MRALCRHLPQGAGEHLPAGNHPAYQDRESTPADQWNQALRWAAIYRDFKSMANAAHHDDETTEGFTWSRADAEAVLAAMVGFLGRYTARK